MLANRIAWYAARHGIALPSVLGNARLGLVGTVRVTGELPLVLTVGVRAGLEDQGEALVSSFNQSDISAHIEFKSGQSQAAFDALIVNGVLGDASLVLATPRTTIRCVPKDDCLLVVGLWSSSMRPSTLLLARFQLGAASGFDANGLMRLVAQQHQLKARRQALEEQESQARAFLLGYRRFLETVRAHVVRSSPRAEYDLVGLQPVRLAGKRDWPRAFSLPRTLVQIPTHFGTMRSFRVVEADDDGEVLTLDGDATAGDIPSSGEVQIRPSVDPLDRMLEALGALAEGAYPAHLTLVDAVSHPEALPSFDRALGADSGDPESARQREAVAMALACPDLCLIHGPPGTGKTTVICDLIEQLVAQGKKVLLVAPTHVALDNVLERVGARPGVVALRLGAADNVDERAQRYLLPNRSHDLADSLVRRLGDAVQDTALAGDAVVEVQRQWRDEIDRAPEAIGSLLLLNGNLICATPIGIAMAAEFRRIEPVFDVMIMDEASKATMCDFLVPASRAQRWVLVGDHKQLAPYAEATELEAVIRERAARADPPLVLPSAAWPKEVASDLRRHFEQRMHPADQVRERAWWQFVKTVVDSDPELEAMTSVPPDEASWRRFADALLDEPRDGFPSIPAGSRAQARVFARFIAELLQLQRISMPSVFETLLRLPTSRVVRLNYQHRMAPELANFSAKCVYDGDYPSAARTASLGRLEIPMLERDSIWIDTENAPPQRRYEYPRDQDWAGGNYQNPLEVDVILEIVEKCVTWAQESWRGGPGNAQAPLEIGIISFYLQQALALRDAIFERFAEGEGRWRRRAQARAANGASIDLHVSIVDRFQGQEKDIVILSATRSNPKAIRGHVNNLNRLNVAVTRARHKRIFVGDAATLRLTRSGKPREADDLLMQLFDQSEVKFKWGKTLSGERR